MSSGSEYFDQSNIAFNPFVNVMDIDCTRMKNGII